MAKHYFKLKFPRVIPLIQFCRPKHHATLPAIHRLSPVNSKALDIGYPNLLPAPPPSTPEYPSIKRRESTKTTTKSSRTGCGSCRSRSCARYISDCNVEIKSSADYERNNNYMSPISETEKYYKKKRKEKKKRAKAKAELPFITTSPGNYGNWFSGEFEGDEENNEQSETPVYSSRSFSNEFSLVLESIAEKMSDKQNSLQKKNKKTYNVGYNNSNTKKVRRANSDSDLKKLTSGEIGRIKTVLRPMRACRGKAGKVRESMAVVKKSEDPHEDFKRSMMEMIMEKQIFEAKELEELLHCFLTLNSRHYQGVIVEAFSEIWELLFSDPSDQLGKLKNWI